MSDNGDSAKPAEPSKGADSAIEDVFKEAAQKLGYKIKFVDGYVVLDEECDVDTQKQIDKVKEECGVDSKQSNEQSEENPQESNTVDPEKKCEIGNMQEFTTINTRGNPNDTIPGTRFKYRDIVISETRDKHKGEVFTNTCNGKQIAGRVEPDAAASLKLMTDEQYSRAVYSLKQLEKFLKVSGVSGKVTSMWRSKQLNTMICGSPTSNHMNGWCVDFKPDGSVRAAFEKLIDLHAKGTICGNQFIYEFKTGNSNKTNGIIHFDFSNPTSSRKGPIMQNKIGGSGVQQEVKSSDQMMKFLQQHGAY